MATVIDCVLHWEVPPSAFSKLLAADAVLVHEFGDQHHVSAATKKLMEIGAGYAERQRIPLVCQHPGELALIAGPVQVVATIEEHLLDDYYLDTQEVNRQFAERCRQMGWERVIVVAHPHHLWRASENLKRWELEVVVPDVCMVPYAKGCQRRAVTSPFFWIPREVIARLYYLVRGWL